MVKWSGSMENLVVNVNFAAKGKLEAGDVAIHFKCRCEFIRTTSVNIGAIVRMNSHLP